MEGVNSIHDLGALQIIPQGWAKVVANDGQCFE